MAVSGLASGSMIPLRTLSARTRSANESDFDDNELFSLAESAVSAAIASGAQFADVRITIVNRELYEIAGFTGDSENIGIGVRSLVDGCWGYVGSDSWTLAEAQRLGQQSVSQARANNIGKKRTVDLGELPAPVVGEWKMPIEIDPFEISVGEKIDFIEGIKAVGSSVFPRSGFGCNATFRRDIKYYVSSEGSRWKQTTYRTGTNYAVGYEDQFSLRANQASAAPEISSYSGAGYEYLLRTPVLETIHQLIEEAEQRRWYDQVDVGRYDLILTPGATAALLDSTLITATELDRILGFEANATGSSYLPSVEEALGTQIASDKITVSCNRSMLNGCATVKWDDDSVEPKDFKLIKDGILTDLQTTYDLAGAMSSWYGKKGMPVESNGCSNAENALRVPIQAPPNVVLHPGRDQVSIEDMISDTKNGFLVTFGRPRMDHQASSGVFAPRMRKITDGKVGRVTLGATVLFRSSEIWNSVAAIGGPDTANTSAFSRKKGEPVQETFHSVQSVPIKLTGVTVVDGRVR